MLAKGYTKKIIGNDGKTLVEVIPLQLPDDMINIIDAISEGLAETLSVWFPTVIVIGNDSITGAPILGHLE
jgi:hypothetical protein